MRHLLAWAMIWTLPVLGADRVLEFTDAPLGEQPPGFRSLVAGSGRAGEWKLELDDAPSPLEPLSSRAESLSKQAVVTQTSREPREGRFPLLVFEKETFQDFKLRTRFKIAGGAMDQMAGIVFRFQNESNFFMIAASASRGTFQCFKVDNGQLRPPIGPEVPISKNEWHDLAIECDGPRIVCSLDGKELVKLIDQAGVRAGHIGYATRADSVVSFTSMRIHVASRDILAQELIRDALDRFPRVEGLQVFTIPDDSDLPRIVASTNPSDIGKPGSEAERDVIRNAAKYHSRGRESAAVTLPLRDRNGEPIAAVRVTMKRFPGQTEQNALLRAQPIVRQMQSRVLTREELLR